MGMSKNRRVCARPATSSRSPDAPSTCWRTSMNARGVTFDIDANNILNALHKSNSIINEEGRLSQAEAGRTEREAEKFRGDDETNEGNGKDMDSFDNHCFILGNALNELSNPAIRMRTRTASQERCGEGQV
ncbi:unnamed protein product [Polarella glacialis]|uniref:Uncharacterized protein n=1 Tax=Polarella glacialis TaxID=89957 RepID=A0A813I8E9_POLGL|nr:unnamed protein product [Polarella glacialis]CAE8646868.1 unnamed protein product [Polarella glacialis]